MLRKNIVCAGLVLAILMLSACGNKSSEGDANLDGVTQYLFTVSGGRATLSVVFTNMNLDAGVRIPLAKPAGAFIELSPDFASAGTLFVISTPIASLFDGTSHMPIVALPDGRAIPGVREGALAAVAVNLPLFGITYLYMGQDVFGIFIPLALPNVPLMVTSRMRDERGNILGTITGIPKAGGSISGILFLFPIEGSRAASFMNASL